MSEGPAPDAPGAPRGRLWLRAALLTTIGGWIWLSPAPNQAFGVKTPGVQTWKMYETFGWKVCDAEFFERTPDGGEVKVDRFAALGHDSRWDLPRPQRRLEGESALRREAVRICAALEPGTDLRARARCGDKRGAWQTVMEGEEPLCAKRGASGGR